MESLPEELIELIAQHLSATDLSRCCAVSVSWRNMFGHDRLWRPHCDRQLVNYLKNTERVVKTDFMDLKNGDSKLCDLSEWRLNFMREACLKNNFLKGNYKIHYYSDTEDDEHTFKIFYKNEHILKIKNITLEVWDLKDGPVLNFSLPLHFYPHIPVKVFEITETDEIVVVQIPIVRVFNLSLTSKRLELKYLFSFIEPRKCEDNSFEAFQTLFKKRLFSTPGFCEIFRNILIAVYVIGCEVTLHIWNVETGHKLKNEVWPFNLTNPLHTSLKYCKETMNVIIHVDDFIDLENVIAHYCVYSLNNLVYIPFYFKQRSSDCMNYYFIANDFIIFDKFCSIQLHQTLYVYNYLTGELLYNAVTDGSLCSFQNNLIFEINKDLCILDPNYKTIVAKFDSLAINGNKLRVINNIATCVFETGKYEASASFIPLKINEETSISFYKFCTHEKALVNSAGSKVILYDCESVVIVHFW